MEARYDWKVKPFDHQEGVFQLSKDLEYYGLLWEMGTGKSYATLMNACHLWSEGKIDCLVILAPNMVHRQWINEQVPMYIPDWVDYECLIYDSYKAGGKQWRADAARLFRDKSKLRIIAVNIEGLQKGKAIEFTKKFVWFNKTMLVVDESSRIKARKSARTKNTLEIGKRALYRRILSGTPITQGVEDLWSQLWFLDKDITGFQTFTGFRQNYCNYYQIPGRRPGVVKITGYKEIDDLVMRIDPHLSRMEKKDCLDLPDKIYLTRYIEMTKKQRDLYEQMKEQLFVMMEDEMIAAPLALTQMIKLQQIVCGHIRDEDGQLHLIDNNRISAAIDLVEECSGKVIIWCRFTPDIHALIQELHERGISHHMIYGAVSSKDREQYIYDFRFGDTKCLVCQTDAAGIGLNLMEASTAIYFSNSFRAEARWQSEDRIHRAGQTVNCTYIDLVVDHSIDTYVLKKLSQKKDVAELVLSELKNEL